MAVTKARLLSYGCCCLVVCECTVRRRFVVIKSLEYALFVVFLSGRSVGSWFTAAVQYSFPERKKAIIARAFEIVIAYTYLRI